jgi:hypothetical protein
MAISQNYILTITHPEAQKPPNNQAIAILAKTTYQSEHQSKNPVTLKHKS